MYLVANHTHNIYAQRSLYSTKTNYTKVTVG